MLLVKVCSEYMYLHSADSTHVKTECILSYQRYLFYTAPCTDGQIRLAGGNIANEGRVEVCLNNMWGTVCDDFWGSADTAIVCQQLGYLKQGQNINIGPELVVVQSQ